MVRQIDSLPCWSSVENVAVTRTSKFGPGLQASVCMEKKVIERGGLVTAAGGKGRGEARICWDL
jgi:hypothetical protein